MKFANLVGAAIVASALFSSATQAQQGQRTAASAQEFLRLNADQITRINTVPIQGEISTWDGPFTVTVEGDCKTKFSASGDSWVRIMWDKASGVVTYNSDNVDVKGTFPDRKYAAFYVKSKELQGRLKSVAEFLAKSCDPSSATGF